MKSLFVNGQDSIMSEVKLHRKLIFPFHIFFPLEMEAKIFPHVLCVEFWLRMHRLVFTRTPCSRLAACPAASPQSPSSTPTPTWHTGERTAAITHQGAGSVANDPPTTFLCLACPPFCDPPFLAAAHLT